MYTSINISCQIFTKSPNCGEMFLWTAPLITNVTVNATSSQNCVMTGNVYRYLSPDINETGETNNHTQCLINNYSQSIYHQTFPFLSKSPNMRPG